jgi:hypothetical protein
MKFGTKHDRSPCKSGSITATVRDFARYKLDLVGVQEVMWGKGGTVRAGDYFVLWKRKSKSSNENRIFFVHHRIVSAGMRVAFVSDWTSEGSLE